jgi:transposase
MRSPPSPLCGGHAVKVGLTGSPDLNPTEEYWRQLKLALGNRYFATCEEIRSAIWPALETISPPGIYQYLCR